MIATILLVLSLFGITVLFWHKSREISVGKSFIPGDVVAKGDKLIIEKIVPFKNNFLFGFKITGLRFSTKIKRMAYNSFLNSVHFVHAHSNAILESLKGKQIKQNKGSVSFFLKNVTEYKEGLQSLADKMNVNK